MKFSVPAAVALLLALSSGASLAEHSIAPGVTRIARWKDDKQAAFTMGFDDSIPTQLTLVVPELEKRKMGATFYLVPGKGEFKQKEAEWNKLGASPNSGLALGDHTMTHSGVKDVANAQEEIGHANEIILKMSPGPTLRLMSFAQPGVPAGHWNISRDEQQQILSEHRLVDRGDFRGHGAMFHEKTADEMAALADSALAKGGVEYIVFHAIGPGTIPTPVPIFLQFLDLLAARQDRLWITDHISAYKYETERDGAETRALETTPQRLRLEIKSKTDPQLYDYPLTLVTQLPAGWQRCQVTQGAQHTVVEAAKGVLRYEALPNGGPITIEPAAGR